jgi:hypothetical protein
MTKTGKEWKKPELIVLVRSKPEEAVLLACKHYPDVGSGASDFAFGCKLEGCGAWCTAWSAS